MRKQLLLAGVVLSAVSVFAQRSPSHPKDIKDSGESGYTLSSYLEDWLDGSIARPRGVTEMDDQFYISRVKPLKRISDGDYQVQSSVDPKRKMCLWVPLDDPTSKWKALPRYCFEGDNFSMWSYIDIHGNWTSPWIRSTAGLTDVAHKNGVSVGCVMSIPWNNTVTINENVYWGSEYSMVFSKLIATNSDGTFKYSDKLVKMMKYYGVDGIGVNSEFNSSSDGMLQLINFFVDCHKKAEAIGWDFQVHWYDGTNESGSIGFDRGLGDHNDQMFGDKDHISVDMMFANYNWSAPLLSRTVEKAKQLQRNSYDYYAGFDIQGRALRNYGWEGLKNNAVSIGFWGAHSQSLLHQSATDDGTSDIAIQKAYLLKQELLFSGGNHNPALLPKIEDDCTLANSSLVKFHGLATYLSAKSTIQTVPFVTRFNLGNGLKFRKDGEVAFDHKWYNLNTQDYMPTWRWWITGQNDNVTEANLNSLVKAELTFDDAYWGGSCLHLYGKTPFSRVKLFKTMLKVQPDYEFSLVYKMKNETATHAKLFVALKNNVTEYKEVEIPAVALTNKWTTFKVKASDLGLAANDEVAMIGIVVDNTTEAYDMEVGELALRNPAETIDTKTPVIKEVQVLRGRYNACDFKIRYASKEEAAGEKTYNDEVGTWYYEIYFKQTGQPQQLLTATTSWAAYVIDAPMVPALDNRRGQIGVRAVSPDGIHGSEIVWSNEVDLPYDQPSSEVIADRPVIKPGEEFTLSYEDVLNPAAREWRIVNPLTGANMVRVINEKTCTTRIDEAGVYDLYVTDSKGSQTIIRGKVVISPKETGAVPQITDITANKSVASQGEQVEYTYTAAAGEGKVSRALQVKDPDMFMIPGDVQKGKTYSYALWFNADKFSHDKQGTNLINKNTIKDSWPHNNWGDLWVTIRPEWTGSKKHPANEISFNTMGWEAHDNPNEKVMSTGYSVTPGIWNHVVVTQNESGLQKIYFNGKKVAEDTFYGSTRRENKGDYRIQAYMTANIFIGGGGVYKAGFVGKIDEVQVWNKVLSDDEVLEAMKGYKEGQVPEGLQAYYTFEQMDADGTFKNLGHGGVLPGKLVAMVNSGGETTSDASYEQHEANNNLTGYPGIEGTLDVKTTPTWQLGDGGTEVSSEANKLTATYSVPGKKTVSLTLTNPWGEATLSSADIVEITSTGTAIEKVDAESGMSIYPNPFVESVNMRFAEGGSYSVNILGGNGTLLQQKSFEATAGQIVNVAVDGPNGVYFVQVIKNGKRYQTLKVVKK